LAVRIRNQEHPYKTLGLSAPTWREILKLALKNGWQPMGSVSPVAPSTDLGYPGLNSGNWEDEAIWQEDTPVYHPAAMLVSYMPFLPEDGFSHFEAIRLVLLEDALNFADALDKAYQAYEPIRVPTSFFLFEPSDPALGRRPSLGALAAALEVCSQGSFSIEPWRFRV
jgi:hypothetical protein